MSDQDRSNDDAGERSARRPYEPPSIVESSAFETLALSCAKVPSPTGSRGCRNNPGSS